MAKHGSPKIKDQGLVHGVDSGLCYVLHRTRPWNARTSGVRIRVRLGARA